MNLRNAPLAGLLLSLALSGALPAAPQPASPPPGAEVGRTWEVPYRLTETRHLLVRLRINGKGPYHYIVDTGAPLLFVSEEIARKSGVEPSSDGWGTVDRLEFEGGPVLTRVQARVEQPFQLSSMNALGLAGSRLDGVLGYNVLCQFRIEVDVRKPVMRWTRLDNPPQLPERLVAPRPGEGPSAKPQGVAGMEALARLATALLPRTEPQQPGLRGYLGLVFDPAPAPGGGAKVASVLPGSPAARAGIRQGDVVRTAAVGTGATEKVADGAHAVRLLGALTAGAEARLGTIRGRKSQAVTVRAAGGTL